jgi:hypothetical protein
MDRSYEAPVLRVLGSVEDLTKDGMVIKIGTDSDMFTALAPSLSGSVVTISSEPR